MATLNDNFAELQVYCKAIKEIDTIKNNEGFFDNDDKTKNTKLEAVFNALSEIDTRSFDTENVNKIVDIIRDSVVKLYKAKQDAINNEMNIE